MRFSRGLVMGNSTKSKKGSKKRFRSLDGKEIGTLKRRKIGTETLKSLESTVLSKMLEYRQESGITKLAEGRYGEVLENGEHVFKIVAVGNGLSTNDTEKQVKALYAEATISRTLNRLREEGGRNFCSTFIKTSCVQECTDGYDAAIVKAQRDWELKHNTKSSLSSGGQHLFIFAQENGGEDLSSFKFRSFKEAQSVLAQVTIALAVAEAAVEFEHRDLHWENILLKRSDNESMLFTLDGEEKHVKTYGVTASIIDFTFSRIKDTPSCEKGKHAHYMDLSLAPQVFEGHVGNRQSETYWKMQKATGNRWKKSCPKTNTIWLQYLVDILLIEKEYDRTATFERRLRMLKKNLETYTSARDAVADRFFKDVFVIRKLTKDVMREEPFLSL